MRPAWAHGRNYDPALLTLSTRTGGFVLGEAVLGVSLLGQASSVVPLDMDFTSITINEPCTVESGMFVHREVATCSLTATLPDKTALRGEWVQAAYDGIVLFEGRVSRAEWTESVDVDRPYLPGNTAVKTYRVSLSATTGEEVLASTVAQLLGPDWAVLDVPISGRVAVLTGYPVVVLPPATDLPLGIWNQDWELGPQQFSHLVYDDESRMSLLDALRREGRAGGFVVDYQPRVDQTVYLRPVNKWLVGDSYGAALIFTDAAITSPSTDPGDAYLTTDLRVSYNSRSISEDPSMFPNSVILNYQIDPSLSGTWTELTYGPYRATDADPQDVVVDYGRVKQGTFRSTGPYDLARAIVQTFPIKRAATAYPSSLSAPLQSTQQLQGRVPGMAVMRADGGEEFVAVVGRTHSISPDKWTVSYDFGPPHLLTRTSDREPASAQVASPTVVPGVSTTFHWGVPVLPSDATWYEVIFKGNFAGSVDTVYWYTSTTTDYPAVQVTPALPAGSIRSFVKTGGTSGDYWYVAYTTNPSPGTSNVSSDVWREGQPAILGQQTH